MIIGNDTTRIQICKRSRIDKDGKTGRAWQGGLTF